MTRPEALPKSYLRYLLNSLRETFGLPGTPIRLNLRKGENPYSGWSSTGGRGPARGRGRRASSSSSR